MTGRILFTLLGLHFALILLAQHQDTVYFNRYWNETVRDSGYYYRLQYFNEDENLYEVKDFYPNHNIQMTGRYISLDPQIRQGKFFWYFSDGKLRQVSEYDHNEIIDVVTSFDEHGNMMQSMEWADVDTPPQFPGGLSAFLDYIDNHLRYPKKARKRGKQGRVVVKFMLNKEGKASDIKVTKSVDPLLDKEAIRVIANSPSWKPAIDKGEIVEVPVVIPISFNLKREPLKGFHSN